MTVPTQSIDLTRPLRLQLKRKRTDRAVKIGITVALVLTLCFSALAYSYLKNPVVDDPWTYPDVADRSPEAALNDIAEVLAGSRGRFVRNAAPGSRADSHQLHFEWRGK